MKMQWSVISLLLLFTLVSCGNEQFTTAPQSKSEQAPYQANLGSEQCFKGTTPPKVDVVYLVDNSSSSYYIGSDIKAAIQGTVLQLGSFFDYRVIGTPLIETASGNNDYQVLYNSKELDGIPADSRRLSTASQFSFFTNSPTSGSEKGLRRAVEFLSHHSTTRLLRNGAYLIVIVVSNGRDSEVEKDIYGNGQTKFDAATFEQRLSSLRVIKQNLSTLRMRMISVTAKSSCKSGWWASQESYVKMANQIYADSGSSDSNDLKDSYDLCAGPVGSIFATINKSMENLLIKHEYRFAPVQFAETSNNFSESDIQVKIKNEETGSITELPKSGWTFVDKGTSQQVMLREGPAQIGPGEPVTGRYFVRLNELVTKPYCVVVTSKTKLEYFQYIVLPQKPLPGFTVWVRGVEIPQSTTNGWSDETSTVKTLNIKAPYPTAADLSPVDMRTGFMIKLNGVNNYYKSGDSVQVNYQPAPI